MIFSPPNFLHFEFSPLLIFRIGTFFFYKKRGHCGKILPYSVFSSYSANTSRFVGEVLHHRGQQANILQSVKRQFPTIRLFCLLDWLTVRLFDEWKLLLRVIYCSKI